MSRVRSFADDLITVRHESTQNVLLSASFDWFFPCSVRSQKLTLYSLIATAFFLHWEEAISFHSTSFIFVLAESLCALNPALAYQCLSFFIPKMLVGIFAAVEGGDTKKVEQLLAQLPQSTKGWSLMDYRHRTVLHLAVEHGNDDMVAMLLRHGGIDLSAVDCGGFTALHLAAELGHESIVARLLGKNPELVLAKSNNHLSCLHLAVIRGHVSVVKLLARTQNFHKLLALTWRSPLHLAVEHGHEEIIELFMDSAKSQGAIGELRCAS